MFKSRKNYYLRPDTSDFQYHHKEGRAITKVIRSLKMNLMSRNITKQLQAIDNILKIINSKNDAVTCQLLIESDIPGLLCDIMNTHNPKLIMRVYLCLLELSKDEEFYRQKHSMIVVETTCRTITILASEGDNRSIIHKGLELLVKILSRCKKEASINKYQVMGIVWDILRSFKFHGIHLAAITLLKTILRAEDFDHKDLPDLLCLTLILLFKLWRNNRKTFAKHSKLALQITSYSLRYFSLQKNSPLSQKALSVGWRLVKSFAVPYMKELDLNKCDTTIAVNILYCITVVYDCFDEKKLSLFSHHLAVEGFLTLLPDFDLHFNNKHVHKCVTSLLNHILSRLAHNVLKFPLKSCVLIGKGLRRLPADSTKWPEILAEAHSGCVHLTIILHLYFVLLSDCHDSLIDSSSQLTALCKHLLTLRSPPSSTLLKAISFVFAVLSLSNPQVGAGLQRELLLATRKLVHWLKSTSLVKVFTRHPAMLYWFFSPQINDKSMQVQAIILWMKDKSQASRDELKNLTLKIDEAALRLLDVLKCCPENLLMEVTSLLKEVLARNKTQKRLNISAQIWINLSSTLSRLSTPGWEKMLKNICCVIFFACQTIPCNLNVTLMLRLSQQLVQTFQKCCGMTWEETLRNTQNSSIQLLLAQLFKLAHAIICKMNLIKDYRGLQMFLEEESLRRGLLACLDCDNEIVTHPSLRLLTYLQQSQKQFNIQLKSRGTVMGGEFLLQLMSTGRADTAFYTANLFSNVQVLDPKVFITLSNDMSPTTIHTLYMAFLNLSVRNNVMSGLSWRCAGLLLQYCHHHCRSMEVQLLYFPLNEFALQVAFKRNGGIGDAHLAEYLNTYVKGVRHHRLVGRRSYASAIARDPVSSMLSVAANQLLTKEWSRDSPQARLVYQICTVGGDIPHKTIKALKLKMPRRFPKIEHIK